MLKKAREAAAGNETGEGKDGATMSDSSRNIWLAGLGAFSRAQAEGMRMFENLVKQGEALESKTRKAASDTATAARGAANGVGGTWDKLEQVFEARVARALAKLGVHSSADVERLSQRVDALSKAVNELIKASGAKVPRKTAKAKAKRAAKKPARRAGA